MPDGENLVLPAPTARLRLDLLQNARTVFQQKICSAHFTLLELLVRIERGQQLLGMAQHLGVLARLGAGCLVAKPLQLVAHLRAGILSRIHQRLIELFQRLLDRLERLLQVLRG